LFKYRKTVDDAELKCLESLITGLIVNVCF